jgi:hypothetical protein
LLALFLPHKKHTRRLVVDTPDHTFVHIVEYLIDFSLTKIYQPISFIPEIPLVNPPSSTYLSTYDSKYEESSSNSENSDNKSDNMENKNE